MIYLSTISISVQVGNDTRHHYFSTWTYIYLLIAARASKISLNSQLFSFQQLGGLEAAGWTARSRRTFGSAFSHAGWEIHISGLELAIFIAVLRQEIWTRDIWPRIGHFHCRREARNMDARYLASNRPFLLPSWGQKYGHQISCLESAMGGGALWNLGGTVVTT